MSGKEGNSQSVTSMGYLLQGLSSLWGEGGVGKREREREREREGERERERGGGGGGGGGGEEEAGEESKLRYNEGCSLIALTDPNLPFY